MERTPADLAKQQARDDARVRQVRAELANQERRGRGRSQILNDVSALLSGDEPPASSVPQADADGRNPGSDRRQAQDDAARPGANGSDPGTNAPGLQIEDGDGGEQKPKPKTLKEWAAEKQLDAKELEALALDDLGDGEPVTFADLKKSYKDNADLQARRDQFEDWHVEQQNEVLQARTELEFTVQELAREVPPAAMARATERAKEALQAQVTKARGQLAEWFPEWSDAQKKAADRDAFAKLMATYGFSKPEVEGVLDARLIKFGMDAMRLMDRYKRLREGERDRMPTTAAPARQKPRDASKNATERAFEIAKKDKIGGIAALLFPGG